MQEKTIKKGSASRKALLLALNLKKVNIKHSIAKVCSDSLLNLANEFVKNDRERAKRMLYDGEIWDETNKEFTSSLVQIVKGKNVYNKSENQDSTLTPSQKLALNTVLNSDENIFITGMPGTGKSYVLARIAMELGIDTPCMSLSNEAVKVMRSEIKAIGGFNSSSTIHSTLGFRVKENKEEGYTSKGIEFIRNNDSFNADTVIIDEIGMVTKELLNDIKESSKRIIAFGDECQLKAINGECDISDFKKIELTESIRFENINVEDTDYSLYRGLLEMQEIIKNGSIVDVEFPEPSKDVVYVDRLSKVKIDGKNIAVGAYTNRTVLEYNEYVQESIHGDGITYPVVGDIVMANQPISVFREGSNINFAKNGELLKVSYVYIDEFNERRYSLQDEKGNRISSLIMKNGIDYQESNELFERYKNHNKGYKKNRYNWYQFKNILVDFRLTHAMTAHKFQGRTVENIGINAWDLDSCRDRDTRNRLFYVLFSRAKKCVYVQE